MNLYILYMCVYKEAQLLAFPLPQTKKNKNLLYFIQVILNCTKTYNEKNTGTID